MDQKRKSQVHITAREHTLSLQAPSRQDAAMDGAQQEPGAVAQADVCKACVCSSLSGNTFDCIFSIWGEKGLDFTEAE